jgi:hypothetical protein
MARKQTQRGTVHPPLNPRARPTGAKKAPTPQRGTVHPPIVTRRRLPDPSPKPILPRVLSE